MSRTPARSIRAAIALVVTLVCNGCGESLQSLNKRAASGSIDQNAPVTAHVVVEIAAPPGRVWALLVDAQSWPAWAPQIERVKSSGPLTSGRSFTWGSNGSTIHSELCEPERRLNWTGRALTAKAVHVWELSPQPGGGTIVTVNESMEGPLMKAIYPSEKLAEADKEWLSALKKAAETKS